MQRLHSRRPDSMSLLEVSVESFSQYLVWGWSQQVLQDLDRGEIVGDLAPRRQADAALGESFEQLPLAAEPLNFAVRNEGESSQLHQEDSMVSDVVDDCQAFF